VAVAWVAARRRSWDAPSATRFFTVAAVGFAVASAAWAAAVTHATWLYRREDFQFVARGLEDAGAVPGERVMSIDAAGTRYWTGHGGVVLVNDPLDTIEAVARAYDIRWLVLNRADSVPAVAPILDGGPRPDWLGAPVVARPPRQPADAPPLPAGAVGLGLYPVCFDPADTRCSEDTP
jgi:hypothetical protein